MNAIVSLVHLFSVLEVLIFGGALIRLMEVWVTVLKIMVLSLLSLLFLFTRMRLKLAPNLFGAASYMVINCHFSTFSLFQTVVNAR